MNDGLADIHLSVHKKPSFSHFLQFTKEASYKEGGSHAYNKEIHFLRAKEFMIYNNNTIRVKDKNSPIKEKKKP